MPSRDQNRGLLRQWDRRDRIRLLHRREINSNTPPEKSINCDTDKEQNKLNNRSIQKVSPFHWRIRVSHGEQFRHAWNVSILNNGINSQTSRKPHAFLGHAWLACEERHRKNPDSSSSRNSLNSVSRCRNRTLGKIGSNSFHLKSRHRSITISTVIYEPERAATGEKLRVRERT